MKNDDIVVNMYNRILATPSQSFFLLGVRGVGKSTWARASLKNAEFIDLLDERLYQDLLADPSLFPQLLEHVKSNAWVVLDEVQRLPRLLNEVHRLIELRGIRFALLGSSARKLKTAGTNLLAGRALMKTMYPFTAAELAKDFDLTSVLRYGSIPLVWQASERRKALEAYVQLYLREEIRAEALVRNLPGFVRFLPIAALFHGQVINISGIARDAGLARTTVQGYLDILVDTLLAFRLPAYEARLRVRERKHPKLYWVDPGVVRGVKRQLGDLAAEERGSLMEGIVLTTLRAHAEVADLYEEIFYWAPHQSQGIEVDFLLRRGGELLAIEVKAADRYHTGLLKGLRALESHANLVRRVLVYTGSRSFRSSDGIEIWPFARFARQIADDSLWP